MGKNLYKMLREAMIENYKSSGLSQTDYAQKVRISRNSFQRLLHSDDRAISSETIDVLMNHFGITYSELEEKYGGEPNKKK